MVSQPRTGGRGRNPQGRRQARPESRSMNRPSIMAFAQFLERRVKPHQLDIHCYRNEQGTKGCIASFLWTHLPYVGN